ncbi:9369_t:CDS:1 [Cetraspora pellucida]|uniref:9369_t:CDS:1 n=1 Tax=Cetraspora pellucida TaxID=1433469 RepID=A0ACA9MKA7_9GLOM|nr:9369_t:CDS:1 [Cetraspora pellucida]
MQRAFVTLIIEPGIWIASKIEYLSRISWYCTCFLIRDIAEDVRDLLILGWSISMTLWNRILNPVIHFIYHSAIFTYHKVREHYSTIGRFLYNRVVLPGVNNFFNAVYGIGSNKTFRLVVEYFIFISPILYNSLVSYFARLREMSKLTLPICVKRIKRSGLEIIQDFYITCMDIITYSSWMYYAIILPVINIIPVVKHLSNSMYKHVKEFLLNIIVPIWKVFRLLLRPVITTLNFFYTTVILVIIFAWLRFAKWLISLAKTMLIHILQFAQQSISLVLKASESAYYAMLPYFNIIISTATEQIIILYTAINKFMIAYLRWFTQLILEVVSDQIYASREFLIGTYTKYEPLIFDLRQRVVEIVDSAVNNIGQEMMNWVKKEQELREAI